MDITTEGLAEKVRGKLGEASSNCDILAVLNAVASVFKEQIENDSEAEMQSSSFLPSTVPSTIDPSTAKTGILHWNTTSQARSGILHITLTVTHD